MKGACVMLIGLLIGLIVIVLLFKLLTSKMLWKTIGIALGGFAVIAVVLSALASMAQMFY